MRYYFLFVLILFVCPILYGQTGYVKIKNILDNKTTEYHELNFPIIQIDNKYVQDKINIHLQLSELELLKGKENKNIFEVTSINDGTIYGGKVSMTYDILSNSTKNLAIKFDESSSGLTMAYWVRYYNFNPQNGDRYSISDFFTKANFEIFRNYITPIRLEKIREQGGTELLNIYLSGYIVEDDLDDFYFTADSIYFDSWNLVHKNDKIDGLDHITGIAINDIKRLLNDFGKAALITGKDLAKYQSKIEPQLYEGVIGSNGRFYLLFRNSYGNEFQGIYAYKRYGRGIDLSGQLTDKEYNFEERDKAFETKATLTFEQQGKNLKGHWQDKNGRKLNLKATRK